MSSGTGLRDWLVQRVTALFLGVYFVYLFLYIVTTSDLTFEQWATCFKTPFAQISTFVALVCVALHAWIGIWTVATDYLKSTTIRLAFLGGVVILLIGYFAWGIKILWG